MSAKFTQDQRAAMRAAENPPASYAAFCAGCRTGYLYAPTDLKCRICSRQVRVRLPEQITCPHCAMRFAKPLQKAEETYCPICLGRLMTPLTARAYRSTRPAPQMSEAYPWLSKKRAKLLVAIANRDNWTCGICGKKVTWKIGDPRKQRPTLDHILPKSRGGSSVRENLQLAHADCNNRKGDTVPAKVLHLVRSDKGSEWPF